VKVKSHKRKGKRVSGYRRKQRKLPSKRGKVTFDAPILMQIKRDSYGRVVGSRRKKISRDRLKKLLG